MPRTVTGIDIGLRNARFLRGYAKGNTFHVTGYARTSLASKEITEGWRSVEVDTKPTNARIGVTGRDVNVRYVRVPRVPDWQLRNLMRFEVEEIGGQAAGGTQLASDFNLLPQLPEIEGEDVVLLAMARESLLEAHQQGLESVGGSLDAFTPNAIALYNAWTRYGVLQDETVLVANVGYDNVDVVIARGPDLLFARNLAGGSRLFEDAIAQRFQVSHEKACELKETIASLDPDVRPVDTNAEKASRAILGAAGQLTSLLQSTVIFCKSQIRLTGLKLDRIVLCGGGAALGGLTKYLKSTMNVPVELFDPWRVVDTTAMPADQRAELEQYALESVIALGLATMASDDAAYGIEILPAATRKKRAFAQQHAWMIGAAALAVAYLGWDAWKTRGELEKVRTEARLAEQQYKRASETHRKAEELVAENARLQGFAHELYVLKGSGEQLARTVALLHDELPADFWVTQIASDRRSDPELGIPRGSEQPIVSVVGKAREGTNSLAVLWEGFLEQARAKLPPGAALKPQMTPSGSKFTLDTSFFSSAAGNSVPASAASGKGTANAAAGSETRRAN
jgi:Tfp pilus assembly PilM family ATPase